MKPDSRKERRREALSLRARLLGMTWGSLGGTILAATLLASAVIVVAQWNAWKDRQGQSTRLAAFGVANALSRIAEGFQTLGLWGGERLAAEPELMALFLDQNVSYLEVAYFDGDARQVVGAARGPAVLASQYTTLQSQWYQTARSGVPYFGSLQIDASGEPYMLIAVPAGVDGVVAGRVRMTILWDIVHAFDPALGETLVVDRSGRVVAAGDPSLPLSNATVRDREALTALSQAQEVAFRILCQDLAGAPALCVAEPIPGSDWVILCTVPHLQALAPALWSVGGLLLGAILLIASSGLVARRRLEGLVFRPLSDLRSAAVRLGQGEAGQDIVIHRQDEIGLVVEEVRRMAGRLRAQTQAIERHSAQLESLYQVGLSLTKRLDLESVLEAVMAAAFELLPDLMDVHIFLYAEDTLTLAASRRARPAGTPFVAQPRRHGSTYRAARTGELILLPDVHRDPNYPGDPKDWPGALACVPLKVGLRVAGVLNAAYEKPHPFDPEETRLLLLLADHAAIAIENARLYGMAQEELMERRRAEQALQRANEDLERKVANRTRELLDVNQRLEVLQEIDRAILAARSLTEIGHAGLSRLIDLVGCDRADLLLFDLARGEARRVGLGSTPTFGLEPGAVIRLEDYGPMEDLHEGRVRRVDDLAALPNLTHLRRQILEAGVRSFLTVPLIADGELIGEINLGANRRAAFNAEDEQLAREVGNPLAVALRQAILRSSLEAEQERLQRLVENLPQGVALLDAEKRVMLANALARQYLPELARWPATATLAQIGGRPLERMLVTAAHPAWHEVRLEAGPRRVFEVAALQLGEGDGAAGWIVQMRDVTGERTAQVQQRAQERLAAVGQLAAGLAHDFNNIVSVILLYAELLQQSPSLSTQDLDRLRTITQQGQRAAQLIQQILDFTRQSVIEQHPFDLVPFMREMESILIRTLPETIRVRVVTEGESLMMSGDPARVRQVCINLALNARDAMPEGGDLRFTLSSVTVPEGEEPPVPGIVPGAWIRMSVADTGAGVKSDVIPHIFEPFFTTKSPAHASGLGLSQVYGIVQQHRGVIGVTSRLGEGTTFHIYFPAHSVEQAESKPDEEPDLMQGKGETILVVEDNEATRASVREILTALGYRVVEAADGKQALETYTHAVEPIDLVLSDLVMPVMGGGDLVRALQTNAPEQRFLLMTGYPLGSTRELLESGQVQWLQKPLSRAKLARAVRRALGDESAGPAES